MKKIILVSIFTFLSSPLFANPEWLNQPLPDKFSKSRWREIYLSIAEAPASTKTRIRNISNLDSASRSLILFFLSEIEPKILEEAQQGRIYASRMLLLDSGLFENEAEKEQWTQEKKDVLAWDAKNSSDLAWQKKQLEFAKLAGDLKGDLADLARLMGANVELSSFPPEAEPLLNELGDLETDVSSAASTLKANQDAIAAQRAINQLEQEYYSGKLPFSEAAKQLEILQPRTGAAKGRELHEKVGTKLARVAAIRSQLAKIKGYSTWAKYQTALHARGHDNSLKTTDQILNLMYSILSQTDAVTLKMYETLAQKVGRKYQDLRPAEAFFLLPPAEQLLFGYFQAEKNDQLWRQTMRESGFPDELVRRVIIDSLPRENKQNHAYMFPVRMQTPNQLVINAATLGFISPDEDQDGWEKAITAIVQNLNDDELSALSTMFHEGGHGLDYASRRNLVSRPLAYGYVETHSTTMEFFTEDLQYLLARGKKRDGTPLDQALVKRYLNENALLNLVGFRGTVMQSIFDIELWDYDYSAPGADTIWQRAEKLTEKLFLKLRLIPLPKDLVEGRGYSMFSTSHFYSGNVRYPGYVFAKVSATLVHSALLDRLEATTGRRTLLEQPTIAKHLIPFYREGATQSFPTSIERFTGKPFSASEYAKTLNSEVLQALSELERNSPPPSCDGVVGTVSKL